MSVIGYHNLFNESGATVTASTEATGFDKENAHDNLGFDYWKPTATGTSWLKVAFASPVSADYFAIWGHDMSDHSATVRARHSTDDITYTNVGDLRTPTNNDTIIETFTTVSKKYWMLEFSNPSTISQVAGVMIGDRLDLAHAMKPGFVVPSIVEDIQYKTNFSETGVFLGGSQRNQGISGRIDLSNVSPAWIRANWKDFMEYAQTPKPFVFGWDETNFETETCVCWVKSRTRQLKPKYTSPLYMSAGIIFEGHR